MRSKSCVILLLIPCAGSAGAQPPPGFEVVDVSHQDSAPFWPYADPDISDCGQVVFNQIDPPLTTSEIYLYDNGQVTRISFNSVEDAESVINSAGTIVWSSGVDGFGNGELLMLRDGILTSFGDGRTPSISEEGHIAWRWLREHSCHSEFQIRFFDGERIVDITNDEWSNHSPVINDLDQIVFNRDDNCRQPWDGEIFLYEKGVAIQVSDRFEPHLPYINNLGQVAWGSSTGIEIWEDGETVLFTDWGWWPRLNNNGDMALMRKARRTSDAWIYIATGNERGFHQLNADVFLDTRPNINDWAEMVWLATDRDTGERAVRMLRRIRTGDSEFDGDIDHDDLAKLVDCMTGPGWVERTNPGPEDSLCECRFLDINHDGSVDLRDYAMFQQNFGGE